MGTSLSAIPKQFLSAIFGSKKAIAAIATLIFLFLHKKLDALGITVTEDEMQKTLYIAIAWLIAQGGADLGKSAAQIHVAAAASTATVTTTEQVSDNVVVAVASPVAVPAAPADSSESSSKNTTAGEIDSKPSGPVG